MANTKLPLGLTRYAGKKFEHLHDAGCMCLTASNVPDLFGLGRNGRMALAAHAMGALPIEVAETGVIMRGKMLQDTVARWYQQKTKTPTRPVHAWIKHPDMEFYASPDVVTTVSKGGFVDFDEHLPGEIKVVAKPTFDEQWEAGPPQKVLLQHQCQLALTVANTGPVIAAVIGDFVFDQEDWDIEAHKETQDLILDEARVFLDMIESGHLPPPDMSSEQDQEAVIKLASVIDGLSIDLPDEMLYHVRRYERAGTMDKAADKMRKAAKAHLIEAMAGAELGVFKNGKTVKLNRINYKEQNRAAYTSVRMNIGQQKKAARPPADPSDGVADAMEWEQNVGDSQNGF